MNIDIKFSLNQVGLSIEAKMDKEWRGIDLIKLDQPSKAMEFCQKWLNDRESYGLGKVYYIGFN